MKDCEIQLETPYSFIFVLICLVTSFAYSVNASGAYMQSLWGRKSNFASPFWGKNNSAASMVSDFGTGASIPPINSTALPQIDEAYSKCNGIDVREITIMQIQELFANNTLTSVMLTNCYLERIHHMNGDLRGVIEVNPDAISEAFKADIERATGINRNFSMMHGIPVLLKENIATGDLMETTAGSLALLGIKPKKDADVVRALRKSGAVILGKANLSEFAYFRGTNIPSGWSGKGGQTRNAYSLNVTPEGSSSGSAVTVSANLATVSVGTETDGSLIAPASIAGICTIKPTLGMLSTKGVIPISHNQDTVGPMGRTVMDIAILLDAMIPEEHKRVPSYAQCLTKKTNANHFRIGVLRFPFWNTTVINSTNLRTELPQLENMVEILQNSVDLEVVDPVEYDIELIKNISSKGELVMLTHDFKHDINAYLRDEVVSSYPIPPSTARISYDSYFHNTPLRRVSTLQDIIQYNKDNPVPEGYNQEILIMSEATDGLNNETYIKSRDSNRRGAISLLEDALSRYNLDAVVTPSESRNEGVLDTDLQDIPIFGYSIAAIAGYPSVNIPAGIGDKGVPFGITFIGRPYTEAKLLQIAYAAEQLNPQRKPPTFAI